MFARIVVGGSRGPETDREGPGLTGGELERGNGGRADRPHARSSQDIQR